MASEEQAVSDLLHLSNSYWSVCALHAAVKLDIFTPLSAWSMTPVQLAELLDCDDRGLAMLLNALTALGLLEKVDSAFAATGFSGKFLARTSPRYLGSIILHHHYLMAPWAHLDEALVGGRPIREHFSSGDDSVKLESFEMGMYELAMLNAPRIVPHIDLGGRSRLLDLGGGPGTYAVNFCRNNPTLSAVVFDRPATRPFAEKTIARFGLADRIVFAAGDFLVDPLGGPFDVAWLSHVLHGQGPEECALLLAKVRNELQPEGLLLIQEFVLDDSLDGPLFPALFSLNMLVATERGQAYSHGALRDMLSEAGFREPRRLSLDLPDGAGVIAALAP